MEVIQAPNPYGYFEDDVMHTKHLDYAQQICGHIITYY